MAAVIEIKYFNTFLLKKVLDVDDIPVWGGSFGVPAVLEGNPENNIVPNPNAEWVIEESRIQGGYNNSTVDFGVKAYIVETNNTAAVRSSSMIYSGIYNSRTGVNNTNQFSVGEEITKSADPANGSIQLIYAEDTNLIVFQENKISRALIDKDAIYSAEGGGTITSSNLVIGQLQAYAGNYGISKDPGSFAVYGYRKYFTDRYRNAVLRLSQDGLTEISSNGMVDYFRDKFASIDSQSSPGTIVGGWDIYNKQYVLSLQDASSENYETLAFTEDSTGFTSFFTFKPSQSVSLKNKYYTLNNGSLWEHYDNTPNTRGTFYGVQNPSSVSFVFNKDPSLIKSFKTVNYEGTSGWQVDSFKSDITGPSIFPDIQAPETLTYFGYSQDSAGYFSTGSDPVVFSYVMGAYDDYGNSYPNIPVYPPRALNRAGFDRKENKYMATIINNTLPNPGEVSFGDQISGIKGYFVNVTMSTDSGTDNGGPKELFAVSTNYDASSY